MALLIGILLTWALATPARADHATQMKRGLSALEAGHQAEAEVAFKTALTFIPGSRDALINLGIAQLRSGNLRGAFASLQSVRAHYPDDPAVYFHLAEVYYRAGLDQLERDALVLSIRLDPGHHTAHRHLAHALTQDGSLYAAAVEFDYLIASANARGILPHPSVLHARALIHERHGHTSQAISMLDDLLFLHPEGNEAIQARSHLDRLRKQLATESPRP
jgi:tetratricopeptide (TPR) repeat protein